MDKKYTISLNSEVFEALKQSFDGVLHRTLNEMMKKGVSVGKVALTLNIRLEKGHAYDPETSAYEGERETIIPKFAHKVKSTLQYSAEEEGSMGGEKCELVWDDDTEKWCIISSDDQTSLFDADPFSDDLPDSSEDDADGDDDLLGDEEDDQ